MQAASGHAAEVGQAEPSALRRAIRRAQADGRAPAPPPVPPRSPDRAIAAALARAADRVHGLPLFFDRVGTGHVMVAELAEMLPDRALVLVVEGPGDALGVVGLCPSLTGALIEMQALGRIAARPAAERRPTRTDAAVCGDFVDACLTELAAELAGVPGFDGPGVFRIASFLDDPRPLELMLDDVPYRRIDVHLRTGPAGQRAGRLFLALPLACADGGPAALPPAATDAQPPPSPAPAAGGPLGDVVRAAPLSLQAVLCRLPVSLGELRALAPGDILRLPPGALDMAVLETATGQPVLRGRLGELAGHHALRLSAAGAADAAPGAGPVAGGDPLAGMAPGEPPMDDTAGADPFRAGWPMTAEQGM